MFNRSIQMISPHVLGMSPLHKSLVRMHGTDYQYYSALHRSPQFWSSYTGHNRDVGTYVLPFNLISCVPPSKTPHVTAQLCFQHGEWEKIGWLIFFISRLPRRTLHFTDTTKQLYSEMIHDMRSFFHRQKAEQQNMSESVLIQMENAVVWNF